MTIRELEEAIQRANQAYWDKGDPTISDEEYDRLMEELKKLDPSNPLLNHLGTPKTNGGKVYHADKMLSLNKVYSIDDLIDWMCHVARNDNELFRIEPKYDGCSGDWECGVLSTRGDGEWGEDITDKLPILKVYGRADGIKTCPHMRGEILFTWEDFNDKFRPNIRTKVGEQYKTPRNALAGVLGSVGDETITAMQEADAHITFVPYGCSRFTILRNLKDIEAHIEEYVRQVKQVAADVLPCDGMVVRLDDESYWRSLGATAHHPLGSMALKFANNRAETVLREIKWELNREAYTPVAVFDPVEIGGVTIDHATLHNYKRVLDLQTGPGCSIVVERAGDVIPQVVEAEKMPLEFFQKQLPTTCTYCGSKLHMVGPELVCENTYCPRINYCKARDGFFVFDIKGISEETLRKIWEIWQIEDFRNFLDRCSKVECLMQLKGMGIKSATKLAERTLKAISKIEPWRWLAAHCFPGIGINMSKQLFSKHTLGELQAMSTYELQSLPGVGPERAEVLHTGLHSILEPIGDMHISDDPEEEVLVDLRPTVCFTGKMPEKRSYYEALASNNGWRPVDSVQSGLRLLVISEEGHKSSKVTKAEKQGTKIITLMEWLKGTTTNG